MTTILPPPPMRFQPFIQSFHLIIESRLIWFKITLSSKCYHANFKVFCLVIKILIYYVTWYSLYITFLGEKWFTLCVLSFEIKVEGLEQFFQLLHYHYAKTWQICLHHDLVCSRKYHSWLHDYVVNMDMSFIH